MTVLIPSWQNYALPADVDGNGTVEVVDAVILINNLLTFGVRQLTLPAPSESPFLDVDGDLDLDVVDAVLAINYLLNQSQPSQPVASRESPAESTIASTKATDEFYESADIDWDVLAIGTAFKSESEKRLKP